jgi:hypothetical protein
MVYNFGGLCGLVVAIALLPIAARSASAPPSAAQQPQAPVTTNVAAPLATPTIIANTSTKSAATVETRLTSIDAAVQKLAAKSDKTDYTPVLIPAAGGLLGVAIGAFVTYLMQRRLLLHQQRLASEAAEQNKQLAEAKAAQERELASKRAALEIGNSFVQWQLKQLSELYGPLHALLSQSRALYRHMNDVLVKIDPTRFRFEPHSQSGPRGPSMEIHSNGRWVLFRTLLHIEQVYGRGYGVDDYFSEIVETGGRMVKTIQEKAGYVRPEQNDLPAVFGRYLAHYSVLKRLHDHVTAQYGGASSGAHNPKPPIAVIEAAVFPREIDGLVAEGFWAITEELNSWRVKAGST